MRHSVGRILGLFVDALVRSEMRGTYLAAHSSHDHLLPWTNEKQDLIRCIFDFVDLVAVLGV